MADLEKNPETEQKEPPEKPKKEKRTYEFRIDMENYLPQIVHMDTYADEPHTEEKLEQIRKQEKEAKKKAQSK